MASVDTKPSQIHVRRLQQLKAQCCWWRRGSTVATCGQMWRDEETNLPLMVGIQRHCPFVLHKQHHTTNNRVVCHHSLHIVNPTALWPTDTTPDSHTGVMGLARSLATCEYNSRTVNPNPSSNEYTIRSCRMVKWRDCCFQCQLTWVPTCFKG